MSLLNGDHHDSDSLAQQQQQQQPVKLLRRCNAVNTPAVEHQKSACQNDGVGTVKEQTCAVEDKTEDSGETSNKPTLVLLWSPYGIGQTIIFSCCGLFFFFLFFLP